MRQTLLAVFCLVATGCGIIEINSSKRSDAVPVGTATPGGDVPFIRGDANMNGVIDRGDILQIGEHLYAADALACEDAADYDDSGHVTITDAILVGRLLRGIDDPPPNNYPDAGHDPTPDDLHCKYFDSSVDPNVVLDKLVITDRQTLEAAGLAFEHVMKKIVETSGATEATRLELYQRWWSQVDRAENYLGDTDPFDLNGLSDTLENPDSYAPIAAVNRFDLASDDLSDCGEFRVLYGKRSLFRLGDLHNRNLILFEARVPNPIPGNIEGCRPLLDRWNELACGWWFAQAAQLRQMFHVGAGGGVRPIIHADNFRDGAGQIRANTFMNQGQGVTSTWMLREFKLRGTSAADLRIEQVTVKDNAHGARFNTLSFDPFWGDFVRSVGDLAARDFKDISLGRFGEDDSYNAQQSEALRSRARSASFNDYVVGNVGTRSNPALDGEVAAAASPYGLTSQNIFDRATALSCAGCHANEVLPERDLGGGVQRPVSLGFHHINEYGVLSPGMRTVFLPQRQAEWDTHTGPASCE